MVGYAAYNCFNNSSRHKKVTFHRFPKDNNLRKKWIANLKLTNFVCNKNKRLCSDHFSPECYETREFVMDSLGLTTGNKRLTLKEGAVPTIFDFGSPKGRKQMKGKRKFTTSKPKLATLSPRKSQFGSSRSSPVKRRAFEKRQKMRVSPPMRIPSIL
eukprot:gene14700-16226_t